MQSYTARLNANAIAQIRSTASKKGRMRGVTDLLPKDEYPNTWRYQFGIILEWRIKLINRNAVTWIRMFIAIVWNHDQEFVCKDAEYSAGRFGQGECKRERERKKERKKERRNV